MKTGQNRNRVIVSVCVAGAGLVAAIGLRAAEPLNVRVQMDHLPTVGESRAAGAPSDQAPDALALYRANCQMCHGIRGKAPIPEMAFFEREWKHGTSSAQIAKVIAEGVKDTPMLAFKGKLKPAEIAALAKYVRSLDPSLKPEK